MGKRMELTAPYAHEGLSERLTTLRTAAGCTQAESAVELEISQCRMAQCESAGATPPAYLLPAIGQALAVPIDALCSRSELTSKLANQGRDSWRRRQLMVVEKLGSAGQRQVLQLIDALLELGQLRNKLEIRA